LLLPDVLLQGFTHFCFQLVYSAARQLNQRTIP